MGVLTDPKFGVDMSKSIPATTVIWARGVKTGQNWPKLVRRGPGGLRTGQLKPWINGVSIQELTGRLAGSTRIWLVLTRFSLFRLWSDWSIFLQEISYRLLQFRLGSEGVWRGLNRTEQGLNRLDGGPRLEALWICEVSVFLDRSDLEQIRTGQSLTDHSSSG